MFKKIRFAIGLFVLTAATAVAAGDGPWVSSWGTSPERAVLPLTLSSATVREFARLSIGGNRLRVRLSNAYGSAPLKIGTTHVALRAGGVAINSTTNRAVTFNGKPSVTIPPGGLVVSDPVDLSVPDLSDVAISLYFPGNVSLHTEHTTALATTYVSSPGNYTSAASFKVAKSTQTSYVATDVEVVADSPARAIIAIGDSITDGFKSTVDTNNRWPNLLAARLVASRGLPRTAVVNQGISGNQVLLDLIGQNVIARLDRDVLVKSGARYVIVLAGINDIGISGILLMENKISAEDLIAGHRQIIQRARALGLKVYGATLTPFEGTSVPGYFSSAGEGKRQALNAWIRSSGEYDGVIDFDAAVRDPGRPTRFLPAFDSGDHLHPNDAGYQAMANSVDLRLFSN